MNRLGDGIPGVEILVFPAGATSSPADPPTFRSDDLGRFELKGLVPGGYVLALNKPGYQILVAQVDTRLLSFLRLRLISPDPSERRPQPAEAESMDWVLRMPRTDVLKAVQNSPAEEIPASRAPGSSGGDAGGPEHRPSYAWGRIPITGEVRQWYTTALPAGIGGSPLSDSSGRATALEVSGALPDRGDWWVKGVTRSLNTQAGGLEPGDAGSDRIADRVGVAMKYRLSPADSLRVTARYDVDRFQGEGIGSMIPARQEVRTFGYQANWKRGGAEDHGLEMVLGFVQAEGKIPERAGGLSGGMEDDGDPLRDRKWNAGARFMFQPSAEHQVSVRAGTRLFRYDQREDDWILAPVQTDFSMPASGPRGWTVSLSGEDAWTLTEPMHLILGLDYRAWDGRSRLSSLMPRVGARHEGSRTSAEGFLLVRMDNWNGADPPPGYEPAGTLPLGYRAEMSRRLDERWTIQGHILRNPGGPDPESSWELSVGPLEEGSLFLAVPDSTTREMGVRVTNQVEAIETSFESTLGKATGRMTGAPTEAPVLMLGEGEVRYLALSASASLRKTETHLRLDFRRMEGSESLGAIGGMERASRVDLVLLQEVPFLGRQGPTDWRVLLGYQSANQNPISSLPDASSGSERVRRFSGGVGVSF